MSDQRHPVPALRAPVVNLPREIDVLNAGRIRERLVAAAQSGASIVVADMTRTTFCDCEGAYRLRQAHKQAAAHNTELRLAAPSAAVRRVFTMLALDGMAPVYPSVDAALAPRAGRGSGQRAGCDERAGPTED